MSFHDKLASGIGGLGEALFASGPNQYAKGRYLSSRIGASDASRDYKQSQTRDLDYQHGLKEDLIRALTEQKNTRMLQGVQFGDPTNYVGAEIQSGREDVRMQNLADMLAGDDPVNQILARDLNLGMTGPQSATRRRTDLLAPEEEALLKAQTKDIGDQFGLDKALNTANIGLLGSQQGAQENLGQRYRQETVNLIAKGFMDEQSGMLNLRQIEAKMGQEAKESAQKINNLKQTNQIDSAEHSQAFQLAKEKLEQLKAEGQNYKTAMENMKTLKVKGDVTLADFAAVGGLGDSQSVMLGAKKLDKINKEIANLGLSATKTEALTNLYKAREQAVKLGKVNGNISTTQAGALYKVLFDGRHKNAEGVPVRWVELTEEEQQDAYDKGIEAIRSGAMKLGGNNAKGNKVSDALGGGGQGKDEIYQNFLNTR